MVLTLFVGMMMIIMRYMEREAALAAAGPWGADSKDRMAETNKAIFSFIAVWINMFTMGLPPLLLARNFKKMLPNPRDVPGILKGYLFVLFGLCGIKACQAAAEEEAPDDAPLALGLKWHRVQDAEHAEGRELKNPELAAALLTKTEFTSEEWLEFGIEDLRADDYIMAEDNAIFVPDAASAADANPVTKSAANSADANTTDAKSAVKSVARSAGPAAASVDATQGRIEERELQGDAWDAEERSSPSEWQTDAWNASGRSMRKDVMPPAPHLSQATLAPLPPRRMRVSNAKTDDAFRPAPHERAEADEASWDQSAAPTALEADSRPASSASGQAQHDTPAVRQVAPRLPMQLLMHQEAVPMRAGARVVRHPVKERGSDLEVGARVPRALAETSPRARASLVPPPRNTATASEDISIAAAVENARVNSLDCMECETECETPYKQLPEPAHYDPRRRPPVVASGTRHRTLPAMDMSRGTQRQAAGDDDVKEDGGWLSEHFREAMLRGTCVYARVHVRACTCFRCGALQRYFPLCLPAYVLCRQ